MQHTARPAPVRRTSRGSFITAAWYLCVVLGSILPWKSRLPTHGRVHLPLHFATYLISVFLTFGFAPWPGRRVFSVAAAITLAFVTEAMQCHIYRIDFEWRDLMTDTYAVLAGALLCIAIPYFRATPLRSGPAA